MINYSQAKEIIEEELSKKSFKSGIELQVVEEATMEENFGWIFFYDSAEYINTGNLSYILAGNAPLIVKREDGTIHSTGTAHPIDHYIEEYKKANNSPDKAS